MITIIRTVAASSVRKGDRVVASKTLTAEQVEQLDGTVVTDMPLHRTADQVKIGRKNTELLDEAGKSFFYAASGTKVAVVREEKTEEERKAERDAHIRKELLQILESGLEQYAPEQMFAAALKDHRGERRSDHSLVFNTLDYLLRGQAHFDILSAVEELYTAEGRRTEGDIFLSFAVVLASELEPVRRNARALSRSTSTTNNLAEDVKVEVATEYLDGLYTRPLRQAVYQIWADREAL